MASKIILASGSPRRKELLEGIGLPFTVVPSDVDEVGLPDESPTDQVTRLAFEKAHDVSTKYPGHWILGADTIVVINDRILGKPNDKAEAFDMLSLLSGNTHTVYTGYAILNENGSLRRLNFLASEVFIRRMTETEIRDYIETGEPMDKAGSYAIQGIGAAIVKEVKGSYTNVVGLPLCEVAQDFQELGIFDFLQAKVRN